MMSPQSSTTRLLQLVQLLLWLLVSSCLPGANGVLYDSCPRGWLASGEWCIQTFLHPENYHKAEHHCESHGGILFPSEIQSEIDDVVDILKNLFDKGVLESTWIVSQLHLTPRAISRDKDGNYSVITTSTNSAYPFVCSLTESGRRILNFQQLLIPKGAPQLTQSAPSELFFHPRTGADFVPISCGVQANPPASITWFRNDVELIQSSNDSYLLSGGSLLVPAVSSLAYSSFHCVASNRFGKVRSGAVLLKPAFLEAFAERRHDVLPLVEGGAKLDCDAPAHQPKSLSFSWLVGNTNNILKESARVFVSLDGTLLFSYVTPDDDNKYACALALSKTHSGHYGPFFRLRVGGSQPSSAPRIAPHLPQVFPETSTHGDTVYLECFAYGNPIPNYKWSRVDGKALSERCSINNYGRVLRIDGVKASDAGKYRCTAGNTVDVVSADVTLMLKSTPTVLVPLHDRLVATGMAFSLECPLSNADRYSTVEWFKNSEPIVPLLMKPDDRHRFRVEHQRLHVSNSSDSDTGVYQCIVSNDMGVSTSSCLVAVKDKAPTFPLQAMPLKVYAVKGSTLTIQCVYQASPRGHSQWTDAGGNRIPSRGRVRQHKTSLIIQNVLVDDQGLFFCTAHNRLGKAHSQVHLVVIDSPQVKIKSENDVKGKSNISCEVEMECSADCPEALLRWTIDDKPVGSYGQQQLTTRLQEKIKKGGKSLFMKQKMNLQIPNSERIMGRFACSSVLGGAAVEMPTRVLPPPPVGVQAEKEEYGIRLSWKKAPSNREPRDHQDDSVKGYLVELRTRSDRQWRSLPRDVIKKSQAEEFLLNSLQPNMDYQFRVRSLDASSLGDPSAPTEWVHTKASPPQDTVDSLDWKALDSSTLLVEWPPIEEDHQSGENLRYRVSWSEAPVDGGHFKDKPVFFSHHLESKHPQAVLHLNSSEGCRAVALAVRALNDEGPATTSVDTVALISSAGKLRAVEITDTQVFNGTHVSFKWHWVGETECHASHAIKIQCIGDEVEVSASVSAHETEWIMGGLEPETDYICHVIPFDSKGNFGEKSSPISLRTKQYPPRETPEITKLSLKPLSDDTGYTTILEWSAIDLRQSNDSDQPVGYKIYIYISETASDAVILSMPLHRLTDPFRPSARLDGLRLMYMYRIQVAGYNIGGVGPLSQPRTIRLGTTSTLESSTPHHTLSPHLLLLLVSALFLF